MKVSKKMIFREEDAFVAYRMPRTKDHILLSGVENDANAIEDSTKSKFIISSFLKEKFYISEKNKKVNGEFSYIPTAICPLESTSKERYFKDVNTIIEDISHGDYQKIVYSRIKRVDKEKEDLYFLFQALKDSHPNAFVFCYHIPGRGTWCGASPEVLIKDLGSTYQTMALAGTQLDLGLPLGQVEWQDKEKKEQDFIVQFVKESLLGQNIAFDQTTTETVRAGEVLHICTQFLIEKKDLNIISLADQLHPGPAICGTPQNIALTNILSKESHERRDYCGFLGPIAIDNHSSLFINLRSMEVYADAYILYLGGGITNGSIVRSEWQETEDKSQTLMGVIEKTYTLQ